ncbi:MAG TPA: DoxX family protein [Paludibacter sp.]|nr:DoxX family protein [Paludibacter sp.]
MNTILWFIQAILAAIFAMAGLLKIILPPEKLIKMGLKWVVRLPVYKVRFIGISELLGAIGLILPMVLNYYPIITPIAAFGFVMVMVFAAYHHYRYSENKAIVFNVALMIFAAIIVVGRLLTI